MRLELKPQNMKLSRDVMKTIQHLSQVRLDHLMSSIRYARLRLVDINGNRGGVDKLASLTLQLENGSYIHITRKHSAVLPLASDIFDRAAEVVSRFVGRMRENRR